MKKSLYISILMVAAALFSSCERGGESDFSWDDSWNTFNGYMQFSTVVSTRADKAVNMRGRNFGVLGYQYSGTSNWNTAQALATPNTFYNQKVECNAETGICDYDIDTSDDNVKLKQWEDNSRYAFFAYHPHGGSGISLSNSTTVGVPYLTYTYGWLEWANGNNKVDVYSRNDIFDLMTAEDIDCDGSKNVKFNFKHRLFGLEVLATNYNENVYVYEYETDADGNQILDDNGNPVVKVDADGDPIPAKDANGNPICAEWEEDVLNAAGNPTGEKKKVSGNKCQTITDLVVKVSGLKHVAMQIPLQDSKVEEKTTYTDLTGSGWNGEVRFGISTKPVVIPAYNQVEADGSKPGKGKPTSISKNGSEGGKGYVMLIPQSHSADEKLNFAVSWTEASNFGSVQNSLGSSLQFEAGRLYQLIINFVGSGVTIALIEAGSWDPKDVYYTFE